MTNNILSKTAICFSITIFLFSQLSILFVYAHGSGGSYETVVDGYLIDIGYSEKVLREGEPVSFDFNIFREGEESPVEFTDVWVRISPKDNMGTIFAGGIHRPEFGSTGMVYTFQSAGEYDVSARFQDSGETIAEEISFPVTVEGVSDHEESGILSLNVIIAFFLGLIVSAFGVFFRKK